MQRNGHNISFDAPHLSNNRLRDKRIIFLQVHYNFQIVNAENGHNISLGHHIFQVLNVEKGHNISLALPRLSNG